jgi:hypothetical protein
MHRWLLARFAHYGMVIHVREATLRDRVIASIYSDRVNEITKLGLQCPLLSKKKKKKEKGCFLKSQYDLIRVPARLRREKEIRKGYAKGLGLERFPRTEDLKILGA